MCLNIRKVFERLAVKMYVVFSFYVALFDIHNKFSLETNILSDSFTLCKQHGQYLVLCTTLE